MPEHYLTKSDFKVARSCPTKLYYRKMGYPTAGSGDEYFAMLADQGYLVEALARAFYPEGRWIGYREDIEAAARDTMAALTDSCTLFEATFISRGKLARADILVRHGGILELIEIKSRGFNRQRYEELVANGEPTPFRTAQNPREIRKEWQPYLEDAAFQVAILEEIFPNERIVPYLMMPDTSCPSRIDGLHHCFKLRPPHDPNDNLRPSVDYDGDAREIRLNPILTCVNVQAEVQLLLPEVRQYAADYLDTLNPDLRRVSTPLSIACRSCEYRVPDGELRGFHECWGELADVRPHILDLYYVHEAGGAKQHLADRLIGQGKANLLDIPESQLTRQDGSLGERARRQRVQIACTRDNHEWISDELDAALACLTYPLHFVDFETCAPAIPRYRNMRPFDPIAFQWSCRTMTGPDAEPEQADWLQSADIYPNATFVNTLRRQLKDSGSILVWASHESTILRAIGRQLLERDDGDVELAAWITDLLSSGRLVDMHKMTVRHYFHPQMGGRTSLKGVADAVWQAAPSIRARLPEYAIKKTGGPGGLYETLPQLEIDGRQIAVTDGTGANVAYFLMMEQLAKNASLEADAWRRLLRQYCNLDTMAMVIIWWRWRELVGQMKQQHG